MVQVFLLGESPLVEPYHATKLYKNINEGRVCTPALGHPIGTVDNLMSQNSGHAIPPFASPQKKNAKAEMTSGGNAATIVCVNTPSSGYLELARALTMP